jgi:hypothetical protein
LGKLRGHGGEQRLTVVHEHRHVHVHADAPRPAGVEPPPPGAGGEVPALAPGASGGRGIAARRPRDTRCDPRTRCATCLPGTKRPPGAQHD